MPGTPKIKKLFILLLLLLSCIWSMTRGAGTIAQRPQADPKTIEAGRGHFAAHCAACHGADGKGGERGPDIISTNNARRRTIEGLSEVIRKGVPAAGMPGFQLPDQELQELVAYVHSLAAPAIESSIPGNAGAGAAFFFGKGNCVSCHMIKGRGGLLGPDLSELGLERTLPEIEQSLRTPGARLTEGYKLVSVQINNGQKLRGFARNESNYDLQVQSLDGKFYLLRRREIVELVHETASLMPEVKGSEEEMRDLLAYLSQLSGVTAVSAEPVPDSSSRPSSTARER